MRNSLLIILFGILSLVSCRTDDAPGIDMIYFEEFRMQAGLNPFVTHFYEFTIPTRVDFFLDNDVERVDRITNSFARLTNTEGASYDFVESVIVNIIDTETGNAFEAAFREDIPFDTGNTLDLIPSLVDFKDYLTGDLFTLQIRIRLRASTPFSIERNRLDFGFKAVITE